MYKKKKRIVSCSFFIHLFLSDLDGFSYNKYRYQQITMNIHEHATEWWHKWWSKIALKQILRSWKCITKMVQDCYTYNKCQIILSQDCFKIKSTSIEFFYHDDEKHKNTFIECSIMMMFKDCFNKTKSFMLHYFNLQRCNEEGSYISKCLYISICTLS